jgi:hypothetical protein
MSPPVKNKFAINVYCWLLRLYPSGFRGRFEDELIQVFQDMLRSTPSRAADELGLWLGVFPDLLGSIVEEHILVWRTEMKDKSIIWKIPALILFTAWMIFIGWTALNMITGRHAGDPTSMLLGNPTTNFEFQTLNFFLLFSPLIVLLSYLIPLLHINYRPENGIIAQIQIRQAGRFSLFIMFASILFCLAIIGLFIVSRIL